MQNTSPSLFFQMRQNILQTAMTGIDYSPFEKNYLYAWFAGVYPIFNKLIDLHIPFNNRFTIDEENINELASFMEQIWLKGDTITFWQLEDLFEAHRFDDWDRQKLIDGCRYLYLSDMYNHHFWQALLQFATPESELHIITKPFEETELLLMCA